ncbi:hypothetical protein COCMIDRAFT_108867, partial [Bipolaris oryzae ATCC 44560]
RGYQYIHPNLICQRVKKERKKERSRNPVDTVIYATPAEHFMLINKQTNKQKSEEKK